MGSDTNRRPGVPPGLSPGLFRLNSSSSSVVPTEDEEENEEEEPRDNRHDLAPVCTLDVTGDLL